MASRDLENGLLHAGAGTGLLGVQLATLIPGLLPTLALLGVLAAVALIPVLALGLAAAVVVGPALGVRWAWTRLLRRRRPAPAA